MGIDDLSLGDYRAVEAVATKRARNELRVESMLDEVAAVALLADVSMEDFVKDATRAYRHKVSRLKTPAQAYMQELADQRTKRRPK